MSTGTHIRCRTPTQRSAARKLAFQGGIEFYSSEVADSPISREDFETEVGISLLWHF